MGVEKGSPDCTITRAKMVILIINIANQIHRFTIDYSKFILIQIMRQVDADVHWLILEIWMH